MIQETIDVSCEDRADGAAWSVLTGSAKPVPGGAPLPGPVYLAIPARLVLSGRKYVLTTTLLRRGRESLPRVDDAIRYTRQLTHNWACPRRRAAVTRPRAAAGS